MFLGAILKLATRIHRLDQNKMIKEIIDDPYMQAQIIDANQSQMMNEGVDSHGATLGDYSPVSVEKYGKPSGHITLYDTGETYDSMKVETGSTGFIILANTSLHGIELRDRFPYMIGLTDKSRGDLIPEIKQRMIEKIRQGIYKNY